MRAHGERARYCHGPDEHDQPKQLAGRGCRCEPCVQANRRYAAWQRRQLLYKRPRFVSAKSACAHILALGVDGLGYKQVAAQAHVAQSTVLKVRTGTRTLVRAETRDAILAVSRASPLAAHQLVAATVTWQRLDALIGRGFSKAWISGQLGQNGRALQVSRSQVTVETARAVGVLWRRWQGAEPPPRADGWATRRAAAQQ